MSTTSNQSAFQSYIEAALWSSHDTFKGEEYEDLRQFELAKETESKFKTDIDSFLERLKQETILDNEDENLLTQALEYQSLNHIVHDFWLTRNRHGAGFWDGDYNDELREILTKIANEYGEISLYIGDDELIYS